MTEVCEENAIGRNKWKVMTRVSTNSRQRMLSERRRRKRRLYENNSNSYELQKNNQNKIIHIFERTVWIIRIIFYLKKVTSNH